MLFYLATIALFIAVIGLSCYQNSMENKIKELENRIKELEDNMKSTRERINNITD